MRGILFLTLISKNCYKYLVTVYFWREGRHNVSNYWSASILKGTERSFKDAATVDLGDKSFGCSLPSSRMLEGTRVTMGGHRVCG